MARAEILTKIYSENWNENRHSPQHKCQHICSVCKIFLTGKNMTALSKLILQMVTYLHARGHIKPWRVKMCMQMRADREGHKNNEHHHLASFAFASDKNWLEEKWQSVYRDKEEN